MPEMLLGKEGRSWEWRGERTWDQQHLCRKGCGILLSKWNTSVHLWWQRLCEQGHLGKQCSIAAQRICGIATKQPFDFKYNATEVHLFSSSYLLFLAKSASSTFLPLEEKIGTWELTLSVLFLISSPYISKDLISRE